MKSSTRNLLEADSSKLSLRTEERNTRCVIHFLLSENNKNKHNNNENCNSFLPSSSCFSFKAFFSSLYSSWMSEFSDHKRKQFKTLRNKLHEKVEDGCWCLNLKSRQWMLDESLWSFHKQNGAGERKEVWNWIFPFIFYQLQSGSQCWPLLTNVGSYWTSLLLCSSWSFIEKADTREVLPR